MNSSQVPTSPFSTWRRSGLAGFLLFPLATAIGLLVGHVMDEQRGWIAGLLAGALFMLIRVAWPLRWQRWFWIIAAAFLVIDVMAVVAIDWSFTDRWNGHTYSGLGMLDFGAMMAIVYGLYRLNYGQPAETFQEDSGDLPDYSQRDLEV